MVSVFHLLNFIKELDPVTYKQYTFEKFKEGHTGKNLVVETPEDVFRKIDNSKPKFKKKIVIDLPSAYDVLNLNITLSLDHLQWDILLTENFQEFVNTLKPGAFEHPKFGEPRIVIPLVRGDKLIGLQGRAYLQILLNT